MGGLETLHHSLHKRTVQTSALANQDFFLLESNKGCLKVNYALIYDQKAFPMKKRKKSKTFKFLASLKNGFCEETCFRSESEKDDDLYSAIYFL